MSQLEQQDQLLKPSQILRLAHEEGKYIWIKYRIDSGDGVHRCALGAIYGHLGWKGWKDGIENIMDSDYQKCLDKAIDMFGGRTQTDIIHALADYNNDGHNYNECADWLEEKGF